jgi:hypothetical protein
MNAAIQKFLLTFVTDHLEIFWFEQIHLLKSPNIFFQGFYFLGFIKVDLLQYFPRILNIRVGTFDGNVLPGLKLALVDLNALMWSLTGILALRK